MNTIAIEPGRGTTVGRVLLERKSVHIHDIQADPDYKLSGLVALGGTRTMLGIPMLREGDPIGVLVLVQSASVRSQISRLSSPRRLLTKPSSPSRTCGCLRRCRHAPANWRNRSTNCRRSARSARAVNSTLELETVLTTIVSRAVQLSRTDAGTIYVFDEACQEFRLHATYGMSEAMIAAITDQHIGLGNSNIGAATTQRKPVQVPDIRNQPSPVNEIILREGYRGVPPCCAQIISSVRWWSGARRRASFHNLLSICCRRLPTSRRWQSENARLYENVEARTRELVKSLEDLRTTQDRLVQTQKLASLGQLTAGIAHEIKNPLNFVNNFSGVSAELIDELREHLEGSVRR